MLGIEAMSEDGTPRLSIVIPTYNERENLPILLEKIRRVMEEWGLSYEVIVVDDDSPDGTWRVALEYAERGYPVRVIRRIGERGLGSAIVRGLREARGEYVVVMDADLQHPPEKIPELVEKAMKTGADLVVATRYAAGGGVAEWSLFRRLVSKGATLLAHILVPWARRTSDPMSGFFLVHRRLAKGRVDPKSWKVLLELLEEAEHVEEVPYVFQPRRAGKSKLGFKAMADYVLHLLRLSGWRPFKFAFVGATGTLVNLGIVKLLYSMYGLPYPLTLLAAFEASLTWNYLLHDAWTFRGLRPPGAKSKVLYWLHYHVASAGSFAAYFTLANTLHLILGLGPLISALAGIVAGFAFNYLYSSMKIWTGEHKRTA